MTNVFHGKESKKLWKTINKVGRVGKKKRRKLAKTVCAALYLIGCKCQELENELWRVERRRG